MAQKKPSAWRYVVHLWNSQDIRRKLLITLGILALYRLAANVPAPGVDAAALKAFIDRLRGNGRELSRFSRPAFWRNDLHVLPAFDGCLPVHHGADHHPIAGADHPCLATPHGRRPARRPQVDGEVDLLSGCPDGRAFGHWADQHLQLAWPGRPIVPFGFTGDLIIPSLTTLLAMTGGTMFAIWLGELISEYGIRGQGLSLIIFAGIVARMPSNLYSVATGDETYRWPLAGFHCRCPPPYYFRHRLRPGGTPQRAGHVPRPPHGQSHVHAGQRYPAA